MLLNSECKFICGRMAVPIFPSKPLHWISRAIADTEQPSRGQRYREEPLFFSEPPYETSKALTVFKMVTRFFAKRMSPGRIILLFHAQMEPLQDLITHLGCPFDEQRDSACRHDSLPSSPACASPRDCQTNGNKVCHRPRTREFSVSSEQEFYFPHFQTILWRNESKLKMVL